MELKRNRTGFSHKDVSIYKELISADLRAKKQTPYDFMQLYKKAVVVEDYEMCQAITDVLAPLNFFTRDTHPHIKELN